MAAEGLLTIKKPGEPCEMRLIPGVTYRGKALVVTCDVDLQLL